MTVLAPVTLPDGAVGWDCSTRLTRTVIAQAKADGMQFCMKYAPYLSVDRDKVWHSDEIAWCVELGVLIGAHFEIQADRALVSPEKGATDGPLARASMTALGFPAECTIYAAIDTDVHAPNSAAAGQYIRGYLDSVAGDHEGFYGDSDVARLAQAAGGDVDIILPVSAYGWSPELAHTTSVAQRIAIARTIPGVRIVQLHSVTRWGIAVDPLQVIEPTTFAGVAIQHPDVIRPTEDTDMPYIITAPDRNPAIVDAGYAVGISGATLAAAKLTVQPVTNDEWDFIVSNSDAKKAADAKMAQGVTVTVPPITLPPVQFPAYTVTPQV